MKRIITAFLAFMMLMTTAAFAKDIKGDLESAMSKFFVSKNMKNLSVKVDIVKKLDDPAGMYFAKMTLKDSSNGRTQEDYVFTDGTYIYPEIVKADTQMNLKDKLVFESTPVTKLDLSKLTFMEGNKNSKNVIVKVSDFECPYCRRGYAAIHEILKHENVDAAIYMMHLPLAFHPKAMIYAKIFEAGLQVGSNFGAELYSTSPDMDKKSDKQLIDIFAAKTKNPSKFKTLVASKAIANKINAQAKMAASLGISGTPKIFFNGKGVEGYNPNIYIMAIQKMK